ncbi:endonuclease/exonuclease/phosphatase family protein [Actinoplanes sp. NPDC051494]|uniref:endonuclease/exonuclease/phosphatase family protein n=1 Tax=Actinoplanes sp. NPDC051494 TaxID=3363907 RepID=UPI0037AB639E
MILRRLRTAFAAALLTLACLVPASPAVAAAPAGTNLQLMTWNMCGSQRDTYHCRSPRNYGTFADKMGVIKAGIRDNYVQALLLQEICENDLAALMADLGSGWGRAFSPYRFSIEGSLSDVKCGNDNSTRHDRYGTAIVIKAGLSDPQIVTTDQPWWRGLQRPVQCATATYFNNIRLCNLHLTPAGGDEVHPLWEFADDQLDTVKEVAGGYADVAFGGDFNLEPPDAAGNTRAGLWPDTGLYWNGATGYRECDQRDATNPVRDGRATVSQGKYDYVFSSRPWRWCALEATAYSDHAALIYSMQIA